jgi:uncharacterized membrane protein (UPF0127 family)
MRKIIYTTVIFIALFLMVFTVFSRPLQSTVFTINGYQLTVEKAETPQQKTQGLSGRKSMQEDQALILVYQKEQPLGIWMPDMHFPLDIFWLDKNCRIVAIRENVPPCQPNQACPVMTPEQPAQYVLETVAGFAKKHQLRLGETIACRAKT